MINIIFLRSPVIIVSRKEYSGWREIQDIYDNYMTSLEFESLESARDWLVAEYPDQKNEINTKLDEFEKNKELLVDLLN
jgi:hypothetical protein